MRAGKFILLLLLLAIILTFVYQNLEKVTVTFVSWSITVPFSLTTFLSFIIGVITGGLAIWSAKRKKKNRSGGEPAEAKPGQTENL